MWNSIIILRYLKNLCSIWNIFQYHSTWFSKNTKSNILTKKNILERKCLYYCINQCSTWKKYQIIFLRLARCVPHGKNYRIQPTLILIAKLHSTLIMPTIENYCSTWEIIFKSIVRTHAKMCSIWNIRNINTHWIKNRVKAKGKMYILQITRLIHDLSEKNRFLTHFCTI